jgi:tetratricopeptide (TPR) repeat protein
LRTCAGIVEKALGPDHPNVATSLNNLAEVLRATNRYAEAEPLYRRALWAGYPNVTIRLNNLALLLDATDWHAEAEPMIRRALAIDEASFGPDHPEVAASYN